MSPCRLLPAVALALAGLVTSGPARAFEKQWRLGGGAGAGFFADSKTNAGPQLELHQAYGANDMIDLELSEFAALHRRERQPLRVFGVSFGALYKIDIIQWIPYVGALFGYTYLDGPSLPGKLRAHELGMSIDLGLDYAVTRSFGVGGLLRYQGYLHDPLASLGDAPYFSVLLRAEYRFGW